MLELGALNDRKKPAKGGSGKNTWGRRTESAKALRFRGQREGQYGGTVGVADGSW